MKILISFGITLGVMAINAVFKPGAWYKELVKPAWTPPSWLFPPVWTLLYLMMGAALYFLWSATTQGANRIPLLFFIIQLIFNAFWSYLFFGLKMPIAGLIDISFLWITLLITIITAWPVSQPASLLLIPYLIWISYATALNAAIWRLN